MKGWKVFAAGCLLVVGVASPALAVIEALTPLSQFERDSTTILLARVESIDAEKGRAIFTAEEAIKGDATLQRLPVRLGGDAAEVLSELKAQDQVVFFITSRDADQLGYGYADGRWFLLIGSRDGDAVRWKYEHGEPFLRRTYSDTTAKLAALLKQSASGTVTLPEPDTTIEKGYGLVAGKHEPPAKQSATLAKSDPEPVASPVAKSPNYALPILSLFAAGTLVWMLTRSSPVKDANG